MIRYPLLILGYPVEQTFFVADERTFAWPNPSPLGVRLLAKADPAPIFLLAVVAAGGLGRGGRGGRRWCDGDDLVRGDGGRGGSRGIWDERVLVLVVAVELLGGSMICIESSNVGHVYVLFGKTNKQEGKGSEMPQKAKLQT